MEDQITVKPAKVFLILPIILLSIGVILIIVSIVGIVQFSFSSRPPLTMGEVFTVEEGGRYEIYYEYQYAYALNQDLTFYFLNTETGEVTESTYPFGNSTYSLGGRSGHLIGVVQLERGEYIAGSEPVPSGGLDFVIVRGSLVASILQSVFLMLGGIILFVGGLVWMIIVLVMRRNFKRRQMQPPVPYGPYGNPPGYY